MDAFDRRQTAPIWARVYGASTAPPEPDAPAVSNQRLVNRLPFLIDEKRQNAVTYYHMARAAGADAPPLRRMAQEEAGHARTLTTLYFFLTGRQLPPDQPLIGTESRLTQMLAAQYRREIADAATYEQMAGEFPSQNAVFSALAEQDAAHARNLLSLAEHIM